MTARRHASSPHQLTMFLVLPAKPKPLTEGQIDDLFREFYRAYPRHKAPKAARKAFGTAIKEAEFSDIMQGVDRYAADIERKGTRPHYIAHPATWLNAGRWADEPDERPAADATTSAFARAGLEFRARAGLRR